MQEKPGALYEQLEPVIQGLGYTLIEASSANVKGRVHVNIIAFSENGIGTRECEEISRTILPRLEILLDNRDIALEVSSPGLERKFSSLLEFELFAGKAVKVLVGDQWFRGIISRVEEGEVVLIPEPRSGTKSGKKNGKPSSGKSESISETKKINTDEIVKAQLVFQEVK